MLKTIGLVSDTHGLLRREALDALAGSDLIIHAGDVGGQAVLDAYSELAPLVAIRGNVDQGEWASELPHTAVVDTPSGRLYVLHNIKDLAIDPGAAGFRGVIFGHSHKPMRKVEGEVIYVNPGSAGPRRFHLPVTVARIDLSQKSWSVSFVDVLEGVPLQL